jgi:hypothetical protein
VYILVSENRVQANEQALRTMSRATSFKVETKLESLQGISEGGWKGVDEELTEE